MAAQVSSQDSATLNSLPSWYTNYAQSITNAGLGALNSDVYNYKGAVDQNGNPLPRVAGLTPQQQQASAQVGANQGNWVPALNTGQQTSMNAGNLINGASGTFQTALGQGQTAGNTYNSAIGKINSATPNFDSAGNYIGSATNNFSNANNGFNSSNSTLSNDAIPTISSGNTFINQGQGALSQAQSYLNPAMNTATAGSGTIMDPANQAERSAWMNPYTTDVANTIANLANQNLFENVIPGVNSTFVGNGQFGSTRNGTVMNQALRDNQQAIANADAQMLLQAQNQADQQYAAEKDRQLQGAQTMGGLAQVGSNIGGTEGNLANANTNIGSALTNAAQAQTANATGQTNLGNSVVNQGNAMASLGNDRVNQGNALTSVGNGQGALSAITAGIGNDQVNQGSALNQVGLALAQDAQMRQALGINDVNALLTTGGLTQATNQKALDAALADFYDRRDFPLSTLSSLSGLLPNVSGKVVPDTQVSSVNGIPTNTDPYANLQQIIGIIQGLSNGSNNTQVPNNSAYSYVM